LIIRCNIKQCNSGLLFKITRLHFKPSCRFYRHLTGQALPAAN